MLVNWKARLVVLPVLPVCLVSVLSPQDQRFTKFDRERAQIMLRNVARDVEKHYYDPKFHGVDWEAKVRETKANIDKADSLDSAVSEIAGALDSLNDSHTIFFPPPRKYVHDFGLRYRIIGSRCYIVQVRPGSDAEKKGLKPGGRIVAINGVPISGNVLWRMEYVYGYLRPQTSLRFTLLDESGHQRNVDVAAKVVLTSQIKYYLHAGILQEILDSQNAWEQIRPRDFEKGKELLVVKLPRLWLSALNVDRILGKMRKHRGVVLDLRGGAGGDRDTLERFVGGLFENDLKVYDRNGRSESQAVSVKGRHHDAYTGRLAIVVDSDSASTLELLARIVQLQRRGIIIGDHTAGMVMEMKRYFYEAFTDSDVYYGAFITQADLVMTDGKTLEHAGVEPDILILPTPGDVASGRDPVLAKAATLVGGHLTPEEAGALFPYEWPPLN